MWKHLVMSLGLLTVGFVGVWVWIRLLRVWEISKVREYRLVREQLSRGYRYR